MGAEYDQLRVLQTADLDNCALNLSVGFAPAQGDSFVIITNDGTAPIIGTFAGLPEGALLEPDGTPYTFRISYVGGDGNDVVLTSESTSYLSVSLTSLSSMCYQGEDAPSGNFDVWNSGAGTLNYTITETNNWLSCTPTSGTSTGEHDTITVNYATAGLASGTYNGTITVTAAGAGGSPQTVALTVTVNATSSTVLNTNDSGTGSLRQVITDLNSGDIITFDPALSGHTILLTSGQLLVSNNLTIDASGLPDGITINGNHTSRIFEFTPGTTNSLIGLILTNGVAPGSAFPDSFGGAIYVDSGAVLAVADSAIIGNSAPDRGGGIYNWGELLLDNVLVSGNASANTGGGIHNDGSLTVSNSTLSDHTAISGGGIYHNFGSAVIDSSIFSSNSASFGAGLLNYATLTLNDSTLKHNSATNRGGGVANYNSLTVNRSTLSGNSANDGAGIANANSTPITLNNCTLSGNSAITYGGGIKNFGTLTVNNCTVAANSANNGGGIYTLYGVPAITNSIVAGNWAVTSSNISGSFAGSDNLTSGNPLLAPLGDYGGPTLTMPPLPGSPAIDAGGPTTLTTDQRGFPRVVGSAVDIGSVEFQGASDVVVHTDTVGDLFVGVTGDGILDITSAAVSHTVSNITFRIVLAGDPTVTDWGKYMIAIHSESGGDTTGNPWQRPIGTDVGMNYWLGGWVDYGSGVEAWHYTNGAWTLVGGSVPNGGSPQVPELTITKDSQSVTITSPLWLLGLSLGQTIQFDIYTSGGGGTDGAIDALANSAQTVADWSQSYNSGTNLYTYTLTSIVSPAPTINFDSQLSSIRIAWPSPSTGWYLLQCTDLIMPNWVTPSETVTDNGAEKFIIINPPAGKRFFRLFKL